MEICARGGISYWIGLTGNRGYVEDTDVALVIVTRAIDRDTGTDTEEAVLRCLRRTRFRGTAVAVLAWGGISYWIGLTGTRGYVSDSDISLVAVAHTIVRDTGPHTAETVIRFLRRTCFSGTAVAVLAWGAISHCLCLTGTRGHVRYLYVTSVCADHTYAPNPAPH